MNTPATIARPIEAPASRYRYLVTGFCFLLGLVNYLDRVVVSFAIDPIQKDFGITDARFGLLMSAFAIGTLSVNALSGFLLDRFGVRIVWSIGLFVWSLTMILQGMVDAFWVLVGLRVLLGMGEGVNFPAMNRALVDWMRPTELGKALSISLLGVPLALVIGGLVLAPMISSIGWRWSFIWLGILGTVLGLVFAVSYRSPESATAPSMSKKPTGPKPSFHDVLFNPTLLATGWSFFAFGWVLFFGLTWLPGYLEQTWGMDLQKVGFFSPLPWVIAIVLMPVTGWLSDLIMQRTGSTRLARVHVIWICQLVSLLCFIPVIFMSSVVAAVIFVSIAIGFSMAPNSPYYSICADLFPSRAGLATGIIVTFFSASGVISPVLSGWLADTFGGFDAAFAALSIVVASSVLGLLIFASGRVPNAATA